MFDRQLLRRFYIASLAATAFIMPLSVWLLSFFIVVLALIWLADGGLKRIPEMHKTMPALLIFAGIYFVYLFWMMNTSDINFGLRELKLKLPLLFFPVVIGLSDPLNKKELKIVLTFFIAGVVLSSITGFSVYTLNRNIADTANPRIISLFITHIRLALMVNLSIAFSVFYYFSDTSGKQRFAYLIAVLWLIVFLFLLLSVTGLLIFAALILFSSFYIIRKSKGIIFITGILLIVSALIISAGAFISGEIKDFYRTGSVYILPLQEKTINGNPYKHYTERHDIENGNPVWIYLCEDELRKEWNLHSSVNYDSADSRDQQLRFTLIRYLTSAGLTKDSAGLASLGEMDIKFIENGITNRLFTEGKPVKSRIYEIIWQIDYYMKGGNPSGHSVTQRIEYLKKGWHVFGDNLLSGTGTGDLKTEFADQFIKENSLLDPRFIYLPHNQYLTFLISFGITGFFLICCSFLVPVFIRKSYRSFLFKVFLIIILLSMLGEDTLETHTGVSFFAYFYSLFVFGTDTGES
jgi:O-antigen ligase